MYLLFALLIHTQPVIAMPWKKQWRSFCERHLIADDPYQYEEYSTYQLWRTFEYCLVEDLSPSVIVAEARRRLPYAQDDREMELLMRILR